MPRTRGVKTSTSTNASEIANYNEQKFQLQRYQIMVTRLFIIVLVVNLLAGCRGEHAQSTDASLSDLELISSTGKRVRPLSDDPDQVKVFVFARIDCPISNRYAPELQRLMNLHEESAVSWWLIFPNPQIAADDVEKYLKEYGYTCSALLDPQHRLVARTGATITPEAAVIGKDGQLAYCGRIDDRHVEFGRARPAPTQHDLQEAISATLQGRDVTPQRQEAIGCYIADLKDL